MVWYGLVEGGGMFGNVLECSRMFVLECFRMFWETKKSFMVVVGGGGGTKQL